MPTPTLETLLQDVIAAADRDKYETMRRTRTGVPSPTKPEGTGNRSKRGRGERSGRKGGTIRHKRAILRMRRIADAHERWRSAARNFQGVELPLRTRNELRNIRMASYGYQVVVTRNGRQVSRGFAGFTEETLAAAKHYRDQLLAELPAGRMHAIPAQVLEAVGLSKPVVGISRCPERSFYRVQYRDAQGRSASARLFYYRHVKEEDAYAAAIDFLQGTLTQCRGIGQRKGRKV